MLTIIVATLIIFWLVQVILTDDFFFAAIITAVIVFLFVNIDIEKETIKLKTETEIKQSIDKARDIALDTVEKVGEASVDVEKAFDDGQEKATNSKQEPIKIDLGSFDFPVAQYIDLSKRSNKAASLYKNDSYVFACTTDEPKDCFSNFITRTHSDRTLYICKADKICYRAE